MVNDINNPEYWKKRFEKAKAINQLHRSVFICPEDRWKRIEGKHITILEKHIAPKMSILDVGCGYGRLLGMLPHEMWRSQYIGIDLSPDFIDEARKKNPGWEFVVGNIQDMPFANQQFNIAVMISIRPMIKRELGIEEWDKCEKEIRRVARKCLYLEYDEFDEGSLE